MLCWIDKNKNKGYTLIRPNSNQLLLGRRPCIVWLRRRQEEDGGQCAAGFGIIHQQHAVLEVRTSHFNLAGDNSSALKYLIVSASYSVYMTHITMNLNIKTVIHCSAEAL